MSKFDCFLFISHITLLTACTDQLLYNLSLMTLCSACVKQNTAVKTSIDASSLLAKLTFSDLVGERESSLIINFEKVIKPFLVWNIYFTFFLSSILEKGDPDPWEDPGPRTLWGPGDLGGLRTLWEPRTLWGFRILCWPRKHLWPYKLAKVSWFPQHAFNLVDFTIKGRFIHDYSDVFVIVECR